MCGWVACFLLLWLFVVAGCRYRDCLLGFVIVGYGYVGVFGRLVFSDV